MREYDVIVAGGGVAGVFAAYRISQHRKVKACLIEFGRPPGKRRKQLEGWLGCFPTGNARLCMDDIQKVGAQVSPKTAEKNAQQVFKILGEYGNVSPVKNKKPNEQVKSRVAKLGYDLECLSYAQWKPESVHLLSKGIAEKIEKKGNVDLEFDNEIKNIYRSGGKFIVETERGDFCAKKLILSLGRSGWRLARQVYKNLGIIENDDFSHVGFMAEVPAAGLKDWNGSYCRLSKDDLDIGPLCWNGTVIPEDHVDLVISSWRSNEDRWASEKVAFSVKMKQKFVSLGSSQTERLGKLAYVLCDNRIGRIKVSEYINGHHDLSLIPEYGWLKEYMREINQIFPNFLTKGYINIPDISLVIPSIKIKKDLSAEALSGLFIAGENGGITGLISACLTGYIAGESACK